MDDFGLTDGRIVSAEDDTGSKQSAAHGGGDAWEGLETERGPER